MENMIFPTNFSPLKAMTLFDGLLIQPLSRGILEREYGTSHMDAIQLHGYEKADGAIKSWVIFHTFVLNSRQTGEHYEWTHGQGRKFSLMDEKLENQIDYDHILQWVYLDDQTAIKDKDANYAQLYQRYKALPVAKVGVICNYLNDFSKATRARNINRSISDSSYWQMMVYYSIIEKILGTQPSCTEQHHCARCSKDKITHNPTPQFEWIKDRLIEITEKERIAEEYRNVIWAIRQKIRHSTVHSSLAPTATQNMPQEEDRVSFDLERSLGNYTKDHHAVESLIHMIADVARYLLLDDIYQMKIFPTPRSLGVITLRRPGVAVRGV